MKTKYCTSCKTEQSLDNFSKDKYRADGHKRLCKPCMAAYVRKMTLEEYKKYLEQKKEQLPPKAKRKRNQKELYQVSYRKLNTKSKVAKYNSEIVKIESGKKQDDFTNHFYSHFGFYDVAPDQDSANQLPTQTYSLGGHKAQESYGVGTRYQSK